jgi:chorismate-pyruvate lyase
MASNTAASVRMGDMTTNKARSIASAEWLPAERLGQLDVDARTRPWLIGKGLLTQRMKDACGERFASHLVEQWRGLLSPVHKTCLRIGDSAGLFREEELCCGDQVWVFAQTVIPDSTLCAHPWLAELGDASLGEMLGEITAVERSSHEYARLPVGDPLFAHALRGTDVAPSGLWARRSRVLLRGAPLLAQEAFLPATGRT